MDAKGKRDALWKKLESAPIGPCKYPDVAKMKAFAENLDYTSLVNYEEDIQPPGREKVLCSAGGAVAKVRLKLKEPAKKHFTGMFSQAEYGIVRCSSINEPSQGSSWSVAPAIVPMLALKFFRTGGPSANLVLAHRKSGQKEVNFFAHALSNHFTENVKFPFKSVLKIFKKYSDFPTFSGLSDFASIDQNGQAIKQPTAPYVLVLRPPDKYRQREVAVSKNLAEQFTGFAVGDVLYDVYAVPEPLTVNAKGNTDICTTPEVGQCSVAPAIWHVGKLIMDSPFISSQFADEQLFFRHHLFEGDLRLRPDWRMRVDTMLGAEFYDEVIGAGCVWDPEEQEASAKDPDAKLLRAVSKKILEREDEKHAEITKSLSQIEVLTEVAEAQEETPTSPGNAPEIEHEQKTPNTVLSEDARETGTQKGTTPQSLQRPAICPFFSSDADGQSTTGTLFCPFLSGMCFNPQNVKTVEVEAVVDSKKSTPFGRIDFEPANLPSEESLTPVEARTSVDQSGRITIFVTNSCPHCKRAVTMMEDLGWVYVSISLSDHPEKRKDLLELCNRMTVPQIFFNSRHIGGAAELSEVITHISDPSAYFAQILQGPGPVDPRFKRPEKTSSKVEDSAHVFDDPVLLIAGQSYQYRDFVAQLLAGVEVKDHKKYMRSNPHSFKASELIAFLLSNYKLPGRQDAVQICTQLQKSGVFHPVDYGTGSFEDGNRLYRFQAHEVGLWKALNVERVVSGAASCPPLTLLKRLTNLLTSLTVTHTNKAGLIDYVAISSDPNFADFTHGVCELQEIDLAAMDKATRTAFVINLYNMMIIHATVVLGHPTTDGQRLAFFNGVRYKLGEYNYSLNDLENGILRGNRQPPYHLKKPFAAGDVRLQTVLPLEYRIHFALNCGARSCPAVQWYTAEGIDEELSHAAIGFVGDDQHVRVDLGKRILFLSKVFKWFHGDFGSGKAAIATTVRLHAVGEKNTAIGSLLASQFRIQHLPYDWGGNVAASRVFTEQSFSCLLT